MELGSKSSYGVKVKIVKTNKGANLVREEK